ncbi:MAG: glycerate kinase, partial [Gemmatimonadota bacterium]
MSRSRVVVVAQAFKETLAASEVAARMAAGVRAAGGEPAVVIGSDGGDGLTEALAGSLERRQQFRVTGPLGRPVEVEAGWLSTDTAVFESRLACGLALLAPEERDPLVTTTRGVGEAVSRLVDAGAQRVLVGLGGSATM